MKKSSLILSTLVLCVILLILFCQKRRYAKIDERSDTIVLKKDSNSLPSVEKKHIDVQKEYKEIKYPTPNTCSDKVNTVEGVILHHTAEPTIERSLGVLTSLKKRVGTHAVIDIDGTRYIMANPRTVTYHAGYSYLAGKENCNNFTIGIEFQGNTLECPLTRDQINSAIDYLLPLISQYKIPINNIVTHKMVRDAYKQRHPNQRCSGKVDITQIEYNRFMKSLKERLSNK